jgi:O-antigen ligase
MGPGGGMAQNRRGGYSRPLSELILSPWILVPLAIILGGFVALNFFQISGRYIKLIVAVLFFLAVTRLPFQYAMAIFLVIWPAPTYVYFADSNVIFIWVTLIVWTVRRTLGTLPGRVKTPIDWVILAYLGVHVLSFVNISDPGDLRAAGFNMVWITAGPLFFVLLANAFRTEKHLELGMKALCACALFVDITAIASFYFGVDVIPRWFLFSWVLDPEIEKGGRAGGIFGFHGLLADFSAMMFYLQIVMGMRARGRAAKTYYYLLAALSVLNIINSVNRGGAVIWVLGGVYFLWLYRRRLQWPKVLLGATGAAILVLMLGVANQAVLYRVRLFMRLGETTFTRGIVPENRLGVWTYILNRIPEHPWLGHGPFINFHRGTTGEIFWPHNAYLFYLYTIGGIGLAIFLWMLLKSIWITAPRGWVDFKRGPLPRAAQALFHMCLIMFALAQLRDEHQRGNMYIYYMWLLFAFGMITTRMVRASRRKPAPVPSREPAAARVYR